MEKGPFPLVPLHWFGFGYTALVVSGGIFGYVKTAATSVTFVGVMGMRSYYYGKIMPVGLIAGASLLMADKVGVRMLMTSD
ncbi:transmembrane protein 14B-like isoform X2 [Theropithecus gelada]|uniref:transmembrane protein 14B-like isoform X2 n=1 Tax=Theropithecus gelada TaxID=9565 RepID=UPI000DC19405|nr:transmembrane protein 14B-like isoform X2 [Theropithecus gelada]